MTFALLLPVPGFYQIWVPSATLPSDLAASIAVDSLDLGRSIGHAIQGATDNSTDMQTPRRDQPNLEMEHKPSLQNQDTRDTQVSLPSVAAQLREHVISVVPPLPAIIVDASRKSQARPPRLVQLDQTHSDRTSIDISTEGPSPGQQDAGGVYSPENGGLEEKSKDVVTIRCPPHLNTFLVFSAESESEMDSRGEGYASYGHDVARW